MKNKRNKLIRIISCEDAFTNSLKLALTKLSSAHIQYCSKVFEQTEDLFPIAWLRTLRKKEQKFYCNQYNKEHI